MVRYDTVLNIGNVICMFSGFFSKKLDLHQFNGNGSSYELVLPKNTRYLVPYGIEPTVLIPEGYSTVGSIGTGTIPLQLRVKKWKKVGQKMNCKKIKHQSKGIIILKAKHGWPGWSCQQF